MKKYILLLLAVCLLLAACGKEEPKDTQPATTQPATTLPTSAPTEPTTEPTTEPSTEPTTEPTAEPSTDPTTEPSTEPTEPLPGYWDEDGNRVVEEYAGELCISKEIYNPQGQLICRISNQCYDMELRLQNFEYDEAGRLIAQTCYTYGWPHCRQTMTYDGDNLTEVVNYTYDSESEEYVQTERFAYTYDSNGNRISETFYQAEQPKYTYHFDENGTLTRHILYRDGVATETENVGDLVKLQLITGIYAPILDNDPIDWELRYDGTTLITLPDIVFTDKVIDGEFYLWGVLEFNDEGFEERDEFLLDSQGRLIEHTNYTNGELYAIWSFIYDEQGRLTEESEWYADFGQSIVHHNYDEQGHNISTETYEDGVMVRQTLREFDQRGLMVKETDGMTGEEVTFTHNELGQVIAMTMFMDGEQIYAESRQYDALGHLIIENDAYTYEYHYNEEGLLTSVRHSYGDEVFGDAFVEYRVVYVTAQEAVELLEATNEALDWCLNY